MYFCKVQKPWRLDITPIYYEETFPTKAEYLKHAMYCIKKTIDQ